MFQSIEKLLTRADAGCQLWPHEISQATSLMFNTVYLLELSPQARGRAERSVEAVIAYANSRCVRELHALRHRDEAMRAAAHQGLATLREETRTAALTSRASTDLGLMVA